MYAKLHTNSRSIQYSKMTLDHDLAVAHYGEMYLWHPYDSREGIRFREQVHDLENRNARLRTQPDYPEDGRHVLEDWRCAVFNLIHERINLY
jgi:hypothetical protein